MENPSREINLDILNVEMSDLASVLVRRTLTGETARIARGRERKTSRDLLIHSPIDPRIQIKILDTTWKITILILEDFENPYFLLRIRMQETLQQLRISGPVKTQIQEFFRRIEEGIKNSLDSLDETSVK